MNRGEFLQGLQDALSGEVPLNVVQENIRYYDDYIRTEVQKGRNEQEVLEELGSPRLIARTIIEATPGAGDGNYETYHSYDQHNQQAQRTRTTQNQNQQSNIRYYDLNKWYWKLIGIIMIAVVFFVIITVVGGLLSLVIPLLPVIGIIFLIMWFIRGPRN